MRDITGRRLFILCIPLLFLLLLPALAWILDRVALSKFNSHTSYSFPGDVTQFSLYGPNATGSTHFTTTNVAVDVYPWADIVIIIIYSIALLVAWLGLFGIWELRRVKSTARHERTWSWVMIVVNLLMAGGSLGVLAWAISVQSRDNPWQTYADVGKDGQKHTRETWACQISNFYPHEDWATSVCGLRKATRFLLIPTAVSALLVLLSFWVLIRNRGGFSWLLGDKGIYSAFDGLYEMRPPPGPFAPHPASQYAAQSVAQQTPQMTSQTPQQSSDVNPRMGSIYRFT